MINLEFEINGIEFILNEKKNIVQVVDSNMFLVKGDEVLTQGGIVGKIVKVSDEKDFMVISISDNTEVTIQKSAVSAVLPKGTMKSL